LYLGKNGSKAKHLGMSDDVRPQFDAQLSGKPDAA
jgi:hypothetical protein